MSTGRATRAISRRLRRAIEHRDGGCCTVPGCGRTTGLEIHHIWHWEDGGPTDTSNLITLCAYHHTCHHQGTLGITGNADLPRHTAPGVVFTNRWGKPLDPVGQPIRPTPPSPRTPRPARRVRSRRQPPASPLTATSRPPANASTAPASTSKSSRPTHESPARPPTADPPVRRPSTARGLDDRAPAEDPRRTRAAPTPGTSSDPTRAGPDAA